MKRQIGSIFDIKGSGRAGGAARSFYPDFGGRSAAAEERNDRLRTAVGDRQRLDAELLLHLEGLQARRFLVHVGIDQSADALVDRVGEVRQEALLGVDA